MNIPPYFSRSKKKIEDFLLEVLSGQDKDVDMLLKSARYSVMAGGKRIRGCICLAIGSLFKDENKFLPLASAIEMIHAYSLIHDDLPVMDDDDFRRGKPSNHKVFGEDVAILAGDYLMAKAYEVISEKSLDNGFEAENIVKTIAYLSQAIGSQGMVGGQIMDIKSSVSDCDIVTLRKIHELKTGRFIRASFICPLILSTGNDDIQGEFSLVEYADALGLLFQVIDDVLDVTSDVESFGKPIGSDKDKNKATYVSLMGLDDAKAFAKKLYTGMITSLSIVDNKTASILKDFADMVYKRDN